MQKTTLHFLTNHAIQIFGLRTEGRIPLPNPKRSSKNWEGDKKGEKERDFLFLSGSRSPLFGFLFLNLPQMGGGGNSASGGNHYGQLKTNFRKFTK